MSVHLVKLCVGVTDVHELISWQTVRRKDLTARGLPPEIVHITRMTPKRRDEILAGGSLYWVIKGFIQARQKILDLRSITGEDGVRRCAIVLDSDIILCRQMPKRPFQGWRYLALEDAPRDLAPGSAAEDIPQEMRAALMELGLL